MLRPGEVSLAHNGVLFLPDLSQFKRGAIESLAWVLRERKTSIIRTHGRADFFANALLVTSTTRCPCDPRREHSEFCAERVDRKIGDAWKEDFYLGWKTRFTRELGIETIVDAEFLPGDVPCTDDAATIRARITGAIR